MNREHQKVYVANDANDSLGSQVRIVLEQMGGARQWVGTGDTILIKPNFVAPFRQAVTDFDVIRVVVNEVKSAGGIPIIAESSGYEFNTEQTFRLLGAYDLAKELDVQLMNLDNSPYRTTVVKNSLLRKYDISEIAFSADAIINLPRLKKHSQTDITCGMKNLFGLLSRRTRAKIHVTNLDKGIADLNRIIKPVLTIVDASRVLDRAVFSRMNEQARRQVDGIIAGTEVLAVDRFCCRLMGIDPESIGHISIGSRNKMRRLEYDTISYPGRNYDELTSCQSSLMTRIHRLSYRSVFALEIFLSHFIGMRSLIPYFHYYLGIRPKIDPNLCNQCGDCVEVCPIDVIDLRKKRILRGCMQLRCLQCYTKCNLNAIQLIGRGSLEAPMENTDEKEKINPTYEKCELQYG